MKKTTLAIPEKTLTLNSPKALADFALTLKKFVLAHKLYSNIQGKNYVHVEGWQFAGAAIGIMPVVRKVERVEGQAGEIKYRAEVELVRADGATVGYGFSVCSNREAKRRNADEYVIASMAQTRATGRAYRNTLAWLMKIAGYEPLPETEADGVQDNNHAPKNDLDLPAPTGAKAPEAKADWFQPITPQNGQQN